MELAISAIRQIDIEALYGLYKKQVFSADELSIMVFHIYGVSRAIIDLFNELLGSRSQLFAALYLEAFGVLLKRIDEREPIIYERYLLNSGAAPCIDVLRTVTSHGRCNKFLPRLYAAALNCGDAEIVFDACKMFAYSSEFLRDHIGHCPCINEDLLVGLISCEDPKVNVCAILMMDKVNQGLHKYIGRGIAPDIVAANIVVNVNDWAGMKEVKDQLMRGELAEEIIGILLSLSAFEKVAYLAGTIDWNSDDHSQWEELLIFYTESVKLGIDRGLRFGSLGAQRMTAMLANSPLWADRVALMETAAMCVEKEWDDIPDDFADFDMDEYDYEDAMALAIKHYGLAVVGPCFEFIEKNIE